MVDLGVERIDIATAPTASPASTHLSPAVVISWGKYVMFGNLARFLSPTSGVV